LIVIVISEILSLLFPIKSLNKMIIDSMGIGNKITINDKFVDNSDFASLTIENLSMTIQATPIKVVIVIEVSNNYNSEEIFTRKHRKNKGLGMKNIDDLLQQLGGIQRHWTKERRYFVTIVIFNVYKGNKCGDN
ncbi:MAG: GHKL domain-containing protein, partial [Hafnia alvei]|nr:GHKL domain-containing protein [Hafnia alvei]